MNDVFKELSQTIKERKDNYDENSYTCYLFKQGIDKILKKVGEESAETIIAAKNVDNEKAIVGEVADLFYHVIVMLEELNIPFEDVLSELEERTKKISNLKSIKNTDKNT